MALYTWKCSDCNETTEINRPMALYETPPDEGCEHCASRELVRIIPVWNKNQTALVHGGRVGWHDEEYSRTRSIK